MLRRPSRARGTGTIVILVTGMLALIILAVTLLFVLNGDAENNAVESPGGQSKVTIINPKQAAAAKASTPRQQPDNTPEANPSQPPADELNDTGNNDSSSALEQNTAAPEGFARLPAANRGARQAEPAPSAKPNTVGLNNTGLNKAGINAAELNALPTSHIMDDGDARLTGDWNVVDRNRQEYAGARYHGEGFRIDDGTFGEHVTAQYIFPALRPGAYRVSISYPAAPNRASNVRVVVIDAEGKHEVDVDQTVPAERGKFFEIGDYRLDASQPLVVRFDNEGLFGRLAIDAVKAENLDVPTEEATAGSAADAGK